MSFFQRKKPSCLPNGIPSNTLPKRTCFLSHNHIQILFLKDEPLCFCQRDGPWFLTLKWVHRYPQAMSRLRTDTGAIKFVLSGANIMCPGLTSAGATIHDEVESFLYRKRRDFGFRSMLDNLFRFMEKIKSMQWRSVL